MDIREFLSESRAVSPIIGIILMIAVTVILAVVIGTFIPGPGGQVDSTAPQVNFSLSYDGAQEVTIAYEGGDSIASDELSVAIPSGLTTDTISKKTGSGDNVNVGDIIIVELAAGNGLGDGSQMRLVWISESSFNFTVL